MVKAYGGVLLVADALLMLLKVLYFIVEGIYRLFVPAAEKSVAGEIVLVSKKSIVLRISCDSLFSM